MRICAQAVANYLKQTELDKRPLVIGYDTRFASEDFAAASAEVIAGNKIKVYLCSKAAPTPVVSYAVLDNKAAGGIMITASHNPASWNGFKYKAEGGFSAPNEITAEIERHIANILSSKKIERLSLAEAVSAGLVEYFDPDSAYFKQLARLINLEGLRQHRLKIVVDPMYGAGIGYFKRLLEGGKLEIIEINGERNPSFPGIQPEPIARNLTKLSKLVREQKADVGLATDGDADRIGIVDEKGEFLTPLQVFALLCLYLLEVRGERGAMVKTLTSTNMLLRLGEIFDVPVFETAVGFKYVAPLMIEKKAIIGGEESGGYGFRGHVPERDGILAGLYFLDFMAKTGKTPAQLIDYLYGKVGPHYYERTDFPLTPDKRQKLIGQITHATPDYIADVKVVKLDTTDGFRFLLADNSWLLIRFSGTEPLVRIYAESNSLERVRKLLENGKQLLGI